MKKLSMQTTYNEKNDLMKKDLMKKIPSGHPLYMLTWDTKAGPCQIKVHGWGWVVVGGWVGVAGSLENKANSAQALLELGLRLSLAIFESKYFDILSP